MRMIAAVVASALLLAVPAGAQSWRLDSTRTAALDQVLRAAVAQGAVPGAVVLVTARDSILYHRAFGVLDPATNRAMTPDAIFDIASMTKPITSVGAMMLVEEGKLGLDDPASRYLPELAGRQVLVSVDSAAGSVVTRPARREITVRDLLRHTSGIAYPFSSPAWNAVDRFTRIPYREWPLVHDPGERWTYGMGTAQVGWIIEHVTGLPLEEFFRRRIFGPLGMTETSFSLPAAKTPRLMSRWRRRDGQLTPRPRPDSIATAGAGDGDLISTAGDYARFLQMLLGRGEWRGTRLLSESSVAAMARNQLDGFTVTEQPSTSPGLSAPFPLGAGHDGFGLGFQVSAAGPDGRPDGTLSWSGLYNTHFWIDLKNGVGVIFMTQLLPFYDPEVIGTLRAVERALYQPSAGRR